jgi:CubicO group peptidase (beta-lactamase class C family)
LENLLQMASGLDSNRAGNRTDRLYIGGGLVTETSTAGSLEAIPGSRWKYANNDTLLAIRHLRAALNDDQKYLAYPFNALLHKIGMTHTFPETDWDGNFVMSSQVWTTSRDLLRLGLLHLNDGVWNGERILPEGWAKYVATPAASQPAKAGNGTPSRGYGAQWWLFQDFPGIPADTYAALGNRGQILMIIPSLDLLIVRRGYDMAGGQGFQIQDFAKDVVAALKTQP